MTVRDRFLETLDFNTDVCPPKWEWGYMGETLERWYVQGLPCKAYPTIPAAHGTPTASLYTPAWRSLGKKQLPRGITVSGGGFYTPTQGFPVDQDVRSELELDEAQSLVDVNLLFDPVFEVEVLEENERHLIYQDLDGIKRKFLKYQGIIPTALEPLVTDWESWLRLKKERLKPQEITGRFPQSWERLKEQYRNRTAPLALGGYPYGFFGTPAHLMGYEHLFYAYMDQPELVHDIQQTFTELWIHVYEKVLSEIDVDLFVFWEDVSAGTGSMISPALIREFILPYYKRVTAFLKERGVKIIFVDTDGDCTELIPLFLEGGVTGVYPMETGTGMDLVSIRKAFPKLHIMGGVPKEQVGCGPEQIDRILKPVEAVLNTGGYVPFGDHSFTPEVRWRDFCYYRRSLNSLCELRGKA